MFQICLKQCHSDVKNLLRIEYFLSLAVVSHVFYPLLFGFDTAKRVGRP